MRHSYSPSVSKHSSPSVSKHSAAGTRSRTHPMKGGTVRFRALLSTSNERRSSLMKQMMIGAAALLAVGAFSGSAEAGCLKGALIGGIGGHFLGHHGVAGAA